MDEICGLKFHLLYVDMPQDFFGNSSMCSQFHFITEFVLLIKTPPFYEVNSFNIKRLAHGGILKIFFLDYFSPSFLCQKC
jgi:hypothetical protein